MPSLIWADVAKLSTIDLMDEATDPEHTFKGKGTLETLIQVTNLMHIACISEPEGKLCSREFRTNIDGLNLELQRARAAILKGQPHKINWWDTNGGTVLLIASIGGVVACILATFGVCMTVTVVLAVATTADSIYRYNTDQINGRCAATSTLMAWGSLGAPGSRVAGKMLANTPWDTFFRASQCSRVTSRRQHLRQP